MVISGLTCGFPYAKSVNCTVYCRLSCSDCPLVSKLCSFLWSIGLSASKYKWHRGLVYIGDGTPIANSFGIPLYELQNFLITVTLSVGGLCAVDVQALYEILCLFLNFSNEPLKNMMGWYGFSWCLIVLAHLTITNPFTLRPASNTLSKLTKKLIFQLRPCAPLLLLSLLIHGLLRMMSYS